MIDPRVNEFDQLSNCTCCERHKKNRPTILSVLYEPFPTLTQNILSPDECQCTCRQRARMICRELCGCVRIGSEQAEIQEEAN